jgi:hypothetical protein
LTFGEFTVTADGEAGPVRLVCSCCSSEVMARETCAESVRFLANHNSAITDDGSPRLIAIAHEIGLEY